MKTAINLTIDQTLKDKLRQNRIEISREVNDYLWNLVNRDKENLEGINLEIEKLELDKAEKKLKKWQEKASGHRIRIERYEAILAENEKKRLETEKKQAELVQNCRNCGKNMPEKFKKFRVKDGFVCNSCFMASDLVQRKKWGIQ